MTIVVCGISNIFLFLSFFFFFFLGGGGGGEEWNLMVIKVC